MNATANQRNEIVFHHIARYTTWSPGLDANSNITNSVCPSDCTPLPLREISPLLSVYDNPAATTTITMLGQLTCFLP